MAANDRLDEFKQNERDMWATGDYGAVARDLFWEVGARIVRRVAVEEDDRVLDVACGTGNAAIRAAEAGGRVVGLDLTRELLDVARDEAAAAGVDVEWVEGDAEALPFGDESFDVVLSTFGCMFAPRHEVAAAELARVLRPGGRLGVCSWTPQSSLAGLMRAMFAYLPQGPESGPPPPLWGSEEHVGELFGGTGVELEFAHETVEFRFDSVEDALRMYETKWGPFMLAKDELTPDGRWQALRDDLAGVLESSNVADDDRLVYPGEYLVVVGRKR